MIAKFVHEGNAVDYVPTADVAAGDVVVQEDLVGIAKLDIPAGTLGSLHVTGVFDLPKKTGAGEDIAFGKSVVWHVANQVATTTGGPGTVGLGKAVADAGEDDPTVRVRLEP